MRRANGHTSRFTAPTAPSKRRSEEGELAMIHLLEELRESLRDPVDLVAGESHLHPPAGDADTLRRVHRRAGGDRLQDAVLVGSQLYQRAERGELVGTHGTELVDDGASDAGHADHVPVGGEEVVDEAAEGDAIVDGVDPTVRVVLGNEDVAWAPVAMLDQVRQDVEVGE